MVTGAGFKDSEVFDIHVFSLSKCQLSVDIVVRVMALCR